MATSFLRELLKKLLPGESARGGTHSASVSASDSSIAVGGSVNAPISLTQNISGPLSDAHVEQLGKQFLSQTASILTTAQLPSDSTVRAESEKQLDAQIDTMRGYIANKPSVALNLLENLYASTAATASGRIRFRIKANIGFCHHALGDDDKAAACLCDAYHQAPEEPKTIANNVLGLLLGRDALNAFTFGTEQLKRYPHNEALAGYVVQCAAYLPGVEDPVALVPPQHRDSPEVLTAYVHYLQKCGSEEQWWKVAWQGAASYKDNEALQYYAALASLADACRDPQLERTNTLSAERRERLLPAVAVLNERWQQALKSDEPMRPDQAAIGHNLLTSYLLLHDSASIREFAQVALAYKLSPQEVLEHVGRLAFLIGDIELSKAVLVKAQDSPATSFLVFSLAATTGDVTSLAATRAETIDGFPEQEQSWCRMLVAISVLQARGGITEDELRALLPLGGESKRACVILARRARTAGFNSLSDEAYEKACSQTTPDSDYAGRAMVAREATRRHDWNRVITILDGYVSIDDDNEELDNLALAFANTMPPREQGLQFFNSLNDKLLRKPRFALSAGTLHYNRGDLGKAEEYFLQAIVADAKVLEPVLALARTYLRAEKQESAQELLAGVDIAAVQGSPVDKVYLAQLLARFGRPRDAVTLGYRVLCSASDDAKVNLAYVGLILSTDPNVVANSDTVTPGCWIELENQQHDTFSGCIDDGEPDYRHERITADHPIAAGALGLKVGESFSVDRGFGPPFQWTIKQILNKYVRALQEVMGNYEHRFPDQPGLWSFNAGNSEGDISILLDAIKEQSEREKNNLELYVNKHLPLAVVASMLKIDVMQLGGNLRRAGNPIISSTGLLTDLDSETKKLATADFELVVLDTYTAWAAVCGDLLPLLARIFPRLAVPRSVVDQLLELHSKFDDGHDTEGMSLWWADGQFFRDTFTPEQLKEQGRVIRERIDELCRICEVIPVVWKDTPSALAQQIMDGIGSAYVWDAAYVATSEKRLLLSEDLFYRQWAGVLFPGIYHSWLQAVFKYALDAQIITRAEYAAAIVSLASFKHEYLSVDPETLRIAFHADITESLERFSLLAGYIGGKTPDWPSHIDVAANFLRTLSATSFVDGRMRKAMNTVLSNLLQYAGDKLPLIFGVLLIHSRQNGRMHEALELWRIGHFLPMETIVGALKTLRRG